MSSETAKLSTPKMKINMGNMTVILLTVVLFAILTAVSKTFFTYSNIYSIIYGVSFQFFAIIGFTMLLIMGEMDLSVGAVYAFSGMMVGYMTLKMKMGLMPSIIAALIVCTLIGVITGIIIVKLRLNSMMVTIATQTLIFGLDSNFIRKMTGLTFTSEFRAISKINFNGIHLTVILMLIAVVVFEFMLKKSSFFRKIFFVGENEETARIYGIKSSAIKVAMFGLSAFTAAFGGIFANSRVTYADSSLGQGLEFTVLTAAVLGGASLYGGKGSILTGCIGLIFLSTISNGMVIFNINPLLSQIIVGIILIISVFIDYRANKNK